MCPWRLDQEDSCDVTTLLPILGRISLDSWEIRQGKDFVPDETKKEMQERTDWGDLLFLEEIEPPPSLMPDF
jgi:hypothetical protein